MDIDLRDLDAFVAVARTRNFRRAAIEQRVSVSSLSQRLRGLEERLGVRLMNRTTRSVGLTEAGELLLARVAPAMIDVSDGLSTDLTHLCQESRVSAVLEQAALPIHPLAAGLADSLDFALHGGEAYELLFTAPPGTRIPRTLGGVAIHRIGAIRKYTPGKPTILLNTSAGCRVSVPPGGWEHFR